MLEAVLAFAMPIGHMHTYHSNAYTCKVHALSGFDPVFRTVAMQLCSGQWQCRVKSRSGARFACVRSVTNIYL